MQGLITSSLKLIMLVLLLVGMSGVAHGHRRRLVSSYDAPCKRMTVYYHDILYNGENHANATSSAITQPTELSRSTYFGELVVFDDVVTAEQALSSEPVARAQGFYFYDK
ncbi:hypothetical protein QOZ80_3BG0287890 [Eleusine coracana subsp. coracana]|nr:hypothetical protein QOZ80_3BG0287890 [Eleusine coracana subsp. coracana]